MIEPITYLNGRWMPASQVGISLTDTGFCLGVTVAEQLRTFGGKIFRLNDHLARLDHSLEKIGVASGVSRDEFVRLAEEIVERNHPLLRPGDDLGLSIFVTPGLHPSYSPALPDQIPPTIGLHTYPLPFRFWAEKYAVGQALRTTPYRQVPEECWPADIKCRSRMHYYLADRWASSQEPGARAVLLDAAGNVTEASTANILLYRKEIGLISPPMSHILRGISVMETRAIAEARKIAFVEREITPADLIEADEVMLGSTPFCLLPVTRVDGHSIGDATPGPLYRQFLKDWSARVGFSISEQAVAFQQR